MTPTTGRALRDALRETAGLDDAFEGDVGSSTALLDEPEPDGDSGTASASTPPG